MTRPWPCWTLCLILVLTPHPGTFAAPLSNAGEALGLLAKDLADQSLPVAQRLEIVRALGGWGGADVRAPLLAALKDPAVEIRATAARALGWPDNREAVAALRERAEAVDEANPVKAAAIEALGLIGDRANRPLVVAATKHPDSTVRQGALWSVALGPLTDPSDRIEYLIQLAEDRSLQGLLRCDAVRALFTVNEDRMVDAFVRILETEPRFAIAPIASVPGQDTQQQVMELRRVQARDVAAWVAEGLGQLKAKQGVPLLLKTAEDRSDYFLRMMSMRSLVMLNVPEADPVFTRRLEDQVPEVRILGLIGLTNRGDRAALPSLLARLKDDSPMVRAQAVGAVAVVGGASARPVLEDMQKRELEANVLTALEDALAHLPR